MSFDRFLIQLFVFLLLSFKSSFCIPDVSTLLDNRFENIFSQSIVYLFILFTCFFAEQKFKLFLKFIVSIFSFYDHAFGVKSKNVVPRPRSSKCSPIFFFLKVCSLIFYI